MRWLIAVICLSLLSCATSPAPILPTSGDRELARVLESTRAEEKLPALAAAVIIDGNLHAAAAVGTREHGTENWVEVDDRFLIASCCKAFTATLSAILVEKGVVSWDTTMKEAFTGLDMREEYENITLLQLLSHRAGLPEWIYHESSGYISDRFMEDWWNDRYPPDEMRAAYVRQTVKEKLADEPDRSIFYSNSGYIMAGAMLETVAGMPFEQLMTENLFNPLGLPTAGFGPPVTKDAGNQPFGHRGKGLFPSPITRDFPLYTAPTAAVHISIQDWATFIRLHLDAAKANAASLGAQTLDLLHTPPNGAAWRDDAEENDYGIPSLNYALGWYTLDLGDRKGLLWHPGGNTGFIAQVIMDPVRKDAVLIVTNVRTKHKHLFKALSRIREYYSNLEDLPGIE